MTEFKLMRRRAIFYGIVALLILAGCAGPPVKTPGPENVIVYPPPPAQPRIQFLTSFSNSEQFEGQQKSFNKFVFGKQEPQPIVKPYGITVSGNKLFICDAGIGGLEILDLKEQTFDYFIPGGLGQLQFPINCCVDDEGFLYVADGNRKQVVIFNRELTYHDAISLESEFKPTDVFVTGSEIYVSSAEAQAIYRFDRINHEMTGKIPQGSSNGPGKLYQPVNFTLSDNMIFISDLGGCRVSLYDTDGNYQSGFGSPGNGFGQFTRPKGIAVDREEIIYVVDAAFENVQVFDKKGNLLTYFGGTYKGPGDMWLPADVTIDYNSLEYFSEYVYPEFNISYLIFVTSQYGPGKVSVYGFIRD